MTLLPIGEEAAAARLRTAAGYTHEVEQKLPATVDADIRGRLAQVRENPLDVAAWWHLYNPLWAAAVRGNGAEFDVWDRPAKWAKVGAHIAGKMCQIEAADAPICEAHGPMADSSDPAVEQSHDGHRWHCAGVDDCRSPYWWLDGTYLHRAGPR